MQPTNNLRFVKRVNPDDRFTPPRLILQQEWTESRMGYEHTEWRDVPVAEEE